MVFFGAEGLRGSRAVERGAHRSGPLRFTGQSIAVYGLTVRLHRCAVAVLRPEVWARAARHRRQPPRRAAGGNPDHAVGQPHFHAGHRHRGDVRHADRADHDGVL